MDKLLPCPFCGHDDVQVKDAGFHPLAARCQNQDCQGQGLRHRIKNFAAAAWNKRNQIKEATSLKHRRCPDMNDIASIVAWSRNEIDAQDEVIGLLRADCDRLRRELDDANGVIR